MLKQRRGGSDFVVWLHLVQTYELLAACVLIVLGGLYIKPYAWFGIFKRFMATLSLPSYTDHKTKIIQ